MKNILYTLKFFLAPILFLTISLFIYNNTGWKTIIPLVIVFVLVPIFDIVFPKSTVNPTSKEEEDELKEKRIFDVLAWIVLPVQVIILIVFLVTYQINFETSTMITKIGWIVSMGLSCGILGINVGHELGHRVTSWQRFVGKALLCTSLRMSFYIEHNWGHHLHVSTPEDPSSAKKNEWVYSFIPKSIFLSWFNSWKIQKDLLVRRKKSFFSIYNDVFWYTIIQWGLIIAVAIIFSWQTAIAFVLSAIIGMILLELVNYIEHYGLTRELKKNGKYERTLPIHSWNSNHSISGAFLFNVSRHSDHHFIASRPYHILRDYDTSPNMPTGYPGMIILSLLPPLFFTVMNKKINALKFNEKIRYTHETV